MPGEFNSIHQELRIDFIKMDERYEVQYRKKKMYLEYYYMQYERDPSGDIVREDGKKLCKRIKLVKLPPIDLTIEPIPFVSLPLSMEETYVDFSERLLIAIAHKYDPRLPNSAGDYVPSEDIKILDGYNVYKFL